MADNQGEREGDEAEQEAVNNWTSTTPPQKTQNRYYLSPSYDVSVHACVHVWGKMPDMYVYTTATKHAVWVCMHWGVSVGLQRIYQSRFLFNLSQTFIFVDLIAKKSLFEELNQPCRFFTNFTVENRLWKLKPLTAFDRLYVWPQHLASFSMVYRTLYIG